MAIPNIVADFQTTLALKVAVGATSATLTSATDDDGQALATGTYGFTIDRKNSNKEYIVCTVTGTALTAISTIDRSTGIATSGFALSHRKGAEVIISDFVVIQRLKDVLETGYDSAVSPATDYALATKKYVDDLAFGGATTVDKVTVTATAGETIAARQLVYLKSSDSRWWLCDADTVATIDNVILGIAQGSGTAGNAITSGVMIAGVDTNFSGLTANTVYYASNTAGGISTTSGTNTRVIGIATATTKLNFDPDFLKVYKNYAVDAVGTDAYAITIQSAFGALYAGMEVSFKAGTANTGACTLAVNGLTAKAITKYGTTALVTGDILVNQIVKVIYDGTQFQMVSSVGTIDVSTQATGVLPIANGGTGVGGTTPYSSILSTGVQASGAVNYAHGLGVTPKRIKVTAFQSKSNPSTIDRTSQSIGTYDGTNTKMIEMHFFQGQSFTPTGSSSVIAYVYESNRTATASFDATNVTLTWSGATNSEVVLLIEAWAY